jgi:hypothetical protein
MFLDFQVLDFGSVDVLNLADLHPNLRTARTANSSNNNQTMFQSSKGFFLHLSKVEGYFLDQLVYAGVSRLL